MNNSSSIALLGQENNETSISDCINKLKASRSQLIPLIENLPSQAFIWQPILTTQSIGAQLLHIAYTEAFWLNEALPQDAKDYLWDDYKIESFLSAPNKPLRWYLDLLASTRYGAIEKVKRFSQDGYISLRLDNNRIEKHSLSYVVWRLIEHEAHHRGQITLLKNWYQKAYTPVYA
ncbi:MAG: DinB family protein [Acidobacteria bacterium]|nr:DinB family protein [Acidobacteriota bacterium]